MRSPLILNVRDKLSSALINYNAENLYYKPFLYKDSFAIQIGGEILLMVYISLGDFFTVNIVIL